MKNIKLALVLVSIFVSGAAFAQTPAQCNGQAAPTSPNMHFPVNIMPDVLSGKVSASVRQNLRCYAPGTILTLTDPSDQGNYGKVKIEQIKVVTYNTISADIVARSGDASVAAIQQELVTAYGQVIENDVLTEIYFSLVK